jgi:hypothetical protein
MIKLREYLMKKREKNINKYIKYLIKLIILLSINKNNNIIINIYINNNNVIINYGYFE